MIRSFRDRNTQALFEGRPARRWRVFARQALVRLAYRDAAVSLQGLAVPPSNRLEKLRGDRAGQHSIRINDQSQICFEWRERDAWNVEIGDYH